MKSIYLKFVILLFSINFLSLLCLSQGNESHKYDSTITPKSIPEQLGLIDYENKTTSNIYFDTNNFEIRIWENEYFFFINQKKLWQLIKVDGKFFFKEYNYLLTAVYFWNNKIIYDKYDSLLFRRLPITGGNGVIGYLTSNLNVISKNDVAEEIYNRLVANQIFQLYTYDFRTPCETTKGIDEVKSEKELIDFWVKNYTVEIISKDFHIKYDFDIPKKNEVCKDKSKGMYFANEIMKILK